VQVYPDGYYSSATMNDRAPCTCAAGSYCPHGKNKDTDIPEEITQNINNYPPDTENVID